MMSVLPFTDIVFGNETEAEAFSTVSIDNLFMIEEKLCTVTSNFISISMFRISASIFNNTYEGKLIFKSKLKHDLSFPF